MDWDKLRIFHSVASAGSLTRAGEILNLSQSAVSRQISTLEEQLGTILFHRHARGLILTEQGTLLFDATEAISKRLETTSARIRDSRDEIFGELRVTTTIGFGMLWLAPRMGALYDQYPNLKIDLLLAERALDLPMREADIAIRMKEPSQADLVRRKLMTVRMRLYVTESYLAKYGEPSGLSELSRHRLICQNVSAEQTSAGANLVQRLFSENISSSLTVNNYYGVLQGVLHDLGVGVLPDYLSDHTPGLIPVLPEVESGEIPVYLAYPVELRSSKRIQAFRDFVLQEVRTFRKSFSTT